MLIDEAQAQAAEATKAASDAANLVLQNQVYGAACIFLLIAVGVLFWLLHKSWKDKVEMFGQTIKTAEQSRVAADDNTEATKALTAAVGALTAAVQTMDRAAEGQAQETRHGIANVLQIVGTNNEKLTALQTRGRA